MVTQVSPSTRTRTTPLHGKHIKVAPSSPQWQRKLEAPLRVVLSYLVALIRTLTTTHLPG